MNFPGSKRIDITRSGMGSEKINCAVMEAGSEVEQSFITYRAYKRTINMNITQ